MHFKIFKMIATRGFLTAVECTKSVFRPELRPDPAGELTTLPRPPSRLGRATPPPHSTPSSTPSASRSQNPLRNFFLDTALSYGTNFNSDINLIRTYSYSCLNNVH